MNYHINIILTPLLKSCKNNSTKSFKKAPHVIERPFTIAKLTIFLNYEVNFIIWMKIAYNGLNTLIGGFFMSNENQTNPQEEPKKKISLQEAMKQQLQNKKNKSAGGTSSSNNSMATKKLQSQQTKKVSNSRRKMGV